MTIIDLLSWDAFGSGWFWTLLLLQRFAHSLNVMGIPVDILRTGDLDQVGSILKWRISRQVTLVEGLHVLVIAGISAAIWSVMVLGLWYQIELFTALCFVILPEMAILRLGYSAAVKLRCAQSVSRNNIHYINILYWKCQAVGAVTLLSAVFFGYGYEVLL
tara:strand:+ start:121 stop:603 length:483 start_codon:yes stop_codon:yes gene_type:complete